MPKCEGYTHHVACDKEAEFVITPEFFSGDVTENFRLCDEHMLRTVRSPRVHYTKVEKIRG